MASFLPCFLAMLTGLLLGDPRDVQGVLNDAEAGNSKTIVLITDGKPTDREQALAAADAVKVRASWPALAWRGRPVSPRSSAAQTGALHAPCYPRPSLLHCLAHTCVTAFPVLLSSHLQAEGIKMVVVGAGEIDYDTLKELSSGPSFTFGGWKGRGSRSCKGPGLHCSCRSPPKLPPLTSGMA